VATALLGQPHQLLRSALLACYANGLTGTVAATNDPSPLRLFLESEWSLKTHTRRLVRQRENPRKKEAESLARRSVRMHGAENQSG